MPESPSLSQQQVWVAERLHRICAAYRRSTGTEPCLEQYENQVRLMMAEDVTPAASAWIDVIVRCLRSNTEFQPWQYVR